MARRLTSLGRRNIEIRRIESEEARHVCFSKRRAGLFKKASELAILCGVEVAAVVFSPAAAGKAFSFSHPSVEAIIERFDPAGKLLAGAASGAGTGGEDTKQLVELNRRRDELSARMDAEMARMERAEAAMANERAKGSPVAKLLQANIRDLGEGELMAYAAAHAVVKAAAAAHANQVRQDALNHGRAMAGTARARFSNHKNQVQAPPQQFLLANHGRAMARSCNNNYQVQAPPPQQFLLANHSSAMARSSNNNYQVQTPLPQQFLLTNHGAGFLDQFGAGIANKNTADIGMQIQQMMMAMAVPPSPGFAGAGMEMLLLQQQGFGGAPGPY